MEKRLQVIGHSFGVVIDKPLLKVLGMGRGSVVKLTTDGRRLILERVDQENRVAPSADPRLVLDATAVAKALMNQHGLWTDDFKKLHHKHWRPMAYMGWLGYARAENMTEDELATMRRFEACLAALKVGATKDEAIARALSAHPIEDR
jgi:hypothetical protein